MPNRDERDRDVLSAVSPAEGGGTAAGALIDGTIIPVQISIIDEQGSFEATVLQDRLALFNPVDESDQTPTCDVFVAIPAYNEAETISEVVRQASAYADEVVVVDDGSTDTTAAAASRTNATVVSHRRNRGYGAALKTAFSEACRAGAEHVVILDGDGQHDPADIPRLVGTQKRTKASVVIGSRFVEGGTADVPLYRRFGLFVVNFLTNLSMGVVRPGSWVRDTQSGFRSYDREAVLSLAGSNTIGDWMGASTDILYHAHQNGYAIKEVGTTVTYDVTNASSHHPVTHGIVLVRNILRTVERTRPLTALAIPGFVLALAGIGVGYLTLTAYLRSGRVPLTFALAAVALVLTGLLACFIAIVLHALATYFHPTGGRA